VNRGDFFSVTVRLFFITVLCLSLGVVYPCPPLSAADNAPDLSTFTVTDTANSLPPPKPTLSPDRQMAALPSPLLAATERETAGKVFDAIKKKNWRKARALARNIENETFKNLILWLDYKRLKGDHSFADIAAFLSAHPDWPQRRTLQARAEEAMTDGTEDAMVLVWFNANPPITTHGMVRYAEALLRSGDKDKGIELIRQTWREGNFGYRQERTFIARHRKKWTKADNIARLDRLLWEGKFSAAKRTVRRLPKEYQILAEARMRLRKNRGGVDWAIRRMSPELIDDPGFQYERLRWRRKRGRDDAVEILFAQPDDPVHRDMWWTERQNVARQTLAKGDVSLAYQLASEHRQKPGSAAYAEAEWLAGWIALRFLDNSQQALDHFTRLYENVRYPVSLSRAAYWAGRSLDKIGRTQEAQAWYVKGSHHVTTFHGQLAASRLENPPSIVLPENPVVTEADREKLTTNELYKIVRLLGDIEATSEVDPFILHLFDVAQTPGEKFLIAELATGLAREDLSVKIARRIERQGISLVELGYPNPLKTTVHSLPETALLLALMRQESGFSVQAVSHAGARGLMQLMPATARSVARQINLPFSKNRLMSDPEYNMKLGRAYISGLLNKYDNSYVLALAAYNAGPSRVKKWLKANGDPRKSDVDSLDWIEMIPFNETRTYVQRVLGNLQVYRLRLGTKTIAWDLEKDLHYRRN